MQYLGGRDGQHDVGSGFPELLKRRESAKTKMKSTTGGGRQMQAKLKRLALLVLGWSLIVLGVAGLFLPVLQGVLFLFAGLLILSKEYAWAHNVLGRLRARFPLAASNCKRVSRRARVWLRCALRRSKPKPASVSASQFRRP